MSVIGIKQQIQDRYIQSVVRDGLNFDKILYTIEYLGNDYVSFRLLCLNTRFLILPASLFFLSSSVKCSYYRSKKSDRNSLSTMGFTREFRSQTYIDK